MKVIVKCGSCGISLEVPQKNNEPFRDFRCPNCSHMLRAVFSAPQHNDNAETVYGGQQAKQQEQEEPADDGRTLFAKAKTTRSAYLRYGNQNYALRYGLNTIGRKAPTSDANVQIQTDDHYMSRQHAIIKLTRIANGSLKALISNHKNKHATYVGGQEIMKDDELVLTSGISVKMGNTTLVYIEE